MICCYNAARNDPYKESQHPRYTPLAKVKDEEIRKAGLRRFADNEQAGTWLDVQGDVSATKLSRK